LRLHRNGTLAVTPEIVLTDAPEPGVLAAIARPLDAFNDGHAGPHNLRPLVVMLRDPQSQEILGGLWGRTLFRWLQTQLLVVPEGLRRQGWGSRILQLAEQEAQARGCVGAMVDTFSFQARPFYEKQGYRVFGTLEGYPPGFSAYFLQKRLA
jgi:GNAT superfamily N-acetyltransferase